MGLDIWSYDKDEISDFSKYNYLKNKFDIFITNKDSLQGRHIYQDNINTTQYLRSSYNMYGYNRMADIYKCATMYDILNPILYCTDDKHPITKDIIYQSLGIANHNLSKWKYLDEVLSKNDLLFRPLVLEYYNPDEEINELLSARAYDLLFNSYIVYNTTTMELINNAISNMKKFKFKKYIDKYRMSDEEVLKGILEINKNIIGLYHDDLTYYVETAETIVKFVEELLQMEEPVLCYWG